MKPADFARKTSEAALATGGDYRVVAGPATIEDGLQAVVHLGTPFDADSRRYLLHVADTSPDSDALGSQMFEPREIDPVENGIRFENVRLEAFQGLGELTVPYPE